MVSELLIRFISSIVLLFLVFFTYLQGGIFFYTFILMVAVIQYYELFRITKNSPIKTFILGLLVIAIPSGAIAYLYGADPDVLLWLAFCVWTSDIFCYFIGRHFGKTRMALKISPNKTWVGLIGGISATTVVGVLLSYYLALPVIYYALSPAITIVSQAGDMLESLIKRFYNVKHSSNIIPGHGGVMDRLDGFILCAPLITWLV